LDDEAKPECWHEADILLLAVSCTGEHTRRPVTRGLDDEAKPECWHEADILLLAVSCTGEQKIIKK
jgi:regulator of PEP synthase PpsR (kinase-PPPase family)